MAETGTPQPTTSGDVADTERVFDFFGLPRELRNEIYSLLTKEEVLNSGITTDGYAESIRVTVKNAMLPKLFVLNRQFQAEYEEQFERGQTIVFKDVGSTTLRRPDFGDKYSNAPNAEVLCMAVCVARGCDGDRCAVTDSFKSHAAWIKSSVQQLKKLEQLLIKIYFCQLTFTPDTLVSEHACPTETLEPFIVLPATTRIEIFPVVGVPENNGRDFAQCAVAYQTQNMSNAVWTRKDGWQKSGAKDAKR